MIKPRQDTACITTALLFVLPRISNDLSITTEQPPNSEPQVLFARQIFEMVLFLLLSSLFCYQRRRRLNCAAAPGNCGNPHDGSLRKSSDRDCSREEEGGGGNGGEGYCLHSARKGLWLPSLRDTVVWEKKLFRFKCLSIFVHRLQSCFHKAPPPPL